MSKLEDFKPNTVIRGILPDSSVTVVSTKWFGTNAIELTYKSPTGNLGNTILYRDAESSVEVVTAGRPWSFDGDGSLFRLVSEANRIHLAHLFDPVLAVHTSMIDPLPHQITAVYEAMLPRQPLRFLLADDPGAGKTIMAGLLIKELIARGDLQRCLIVCPGSLVEQWQDELYQRFGLPFEIMTNDKLEAARTGNWFMETNLAIARLDKLSRNEDVIEKMKAPDCRWDLIVCDEAHKMSATIFGGEVKYTKRYHLGEVLSTLTRHFLLMTATPHNGKEEDFQLFMALLDGDRFAGTHREGVHSVDVSDLMRRMTKEGLLRFDGTRLFPERAAYTVPYKLSDAEAQLYREVTNYVREEFNRAEALKNHRRAGTVGFALTILQRRLASSPEAIYQSIRRRKERLEKRLRELELLKQAELISDSLQSTTLGFTEEDIEDIEDAPDDEVETTETEILDQATAANSIAELRLETEILQNLEHMALGVRRSGTDTKWNELRELLINKVFTPEILRTGVAEPQAEFKTNEIPQPTPSKNQKLVIFTEHRDTLKYLHNNITTLLGRPEAVVIIHGNIPREERAKAQESFQHNPDVQILLATDAAGEGINLQRAHLMVNYDLPWNPNRIEQRFGRIHRIGQTEPCYLWNMVAEETREGDVYQVLLRKLDDARKTLQGQVFDVLGKVQFDGKPLKDLIIKAIRDGEKPEVKAWLTEVISGALDTKHLHQLIEEKALSHEVMDIGRVYQIKETMERAEARRLQPYYIESFFLKAFEQLGGSVRQREPRRYEIMRVPGIMRNRDRLIGIGNPVLAKYERIVFEKSLVHPQGETPAAFICPGHPLLDAVVDIILERNRDLLRRGAVLVDENDSSLQPRVLFFLEHGIQDASITRTSERRTISKRMLYVELDAEGNIHHPQYAPYLDYRPLRQGEPHINTILERSECQWITPGIENTVLEYAVTNVVPEHLEEVRPRKLELIAKTESAVKERLTREIQYWDHRAQQLRTQEQAGKYNARLNSGEAQKRADLLEDRMQKRMSDLQLERQISALPPVVLGGVLVLPAGLLSAITGRRETVAAESPDRLAAAAKARAIVMEIERNLGFEPVDREVDKIGYDIESRVPGTGSLRFIEVKGRISDSSTLTVTKNEILTSLNKPEDYILAMVEFLPHDRHHVRYLREPFKREPDFGVTSVNYNFSELLGRAEEPN